MAARTKARKKKSVAQREARDTHETPDLRWGMGRRLAFIEFRLFWEGHVNRGDLMETFKISIAQATTDLSRYAALAPANMAYDKSAKTYVRTPEFRTQIFDADADRYLAQLKSVEDEVVTQGETWIGDSPACGVAPTPRRAVDATILRSVIEAIRRRQALEVKYQALSRPEPRWRFIAPHTLSHDGFRWHARAFCEEERVFKDFLLSRILETRGLRPTDAKPKDDRMWHESVTLKIGPHPGLSDTQKKVIGMDYGMTRGKFELPVRRAFLFYTLKRLGLDADPTARRPQDQQIILLNRAEVLAALKEGRGE